MAKHGRRRKYRRYIRGKIDHDLALTTLAGNTLVGTDLSDAVTETTWCSSIKATWGLTDWTPIASAGPITVGIAHSDYTDAEIEAWLEVTSAWDQGNKVAQEVNRRKCRIVGTFATPEALATAMLNDGKQLTTKVGMMLATGDTLRIWAYNAGTAAIATTVPGVVVQGHANLWPTSG